VRSTTEGTLGETFLFAVTVRGEYQTDDSSPPVSYINPGMVRLGLL